MINIDGSGLTKIIRDARTNFYPTWSPDGAQLTYYSDASGSWDVCAVLLATGAMRSLTDTPGFDGQPAWQPTTTR
ncbi:MAG TPA: hypothetical protein VFM91_11840 [Propionibacteriaceae bacterium]|nr:hypothetical protein [Propionibacteriaceae bacterium]